MSEQNKSFINQIHTRYPNDNDDERIKKFNRFLSLLAEKYHLNSSDIQILFEMFKNGATFEEIKQKAIVLYTQHIENYKRACQQIADEKAGGRGEYQGAIGRNNPKRGQMKDFEITRQLNKGDNELYPLKYTSIFNSIYFKGQSLFIISIKLFHILIIHRSY